MRKLWFKNHLVASLMMVAVVMAVPFAVHAQPVQVQTTTQSSTSKLSATKEKQGAAKTRLTDAKLKVCQQRERTITNIMSRLSDRGTKQLSVFGKITDRTEAFYVKSGKILNNYDALVANVASAKLAAESAITSVNSGATSFNCDGADPKGVAATFRTNVKTEIAALNTYKTAIKDLIVGVKSVQVTTSSPDSKATPAKTADGSKR